MLYDCFLYFDEKELLELRVEILKDVVDGFIITDGNLTFKGDPKPYTCLDAIRELGLPEEKIQVLHVATLMKYQNLLPFYKLLS